MLKMCSSPVEFNLSLKPTNFPRTIPSLLKDISKIDSPSDKLLVLNDHLHKHEEELSRIEPFGHHLPQCMLLLMEAIEILKKEVMIAKNGMESESKEKAVMHLLSMKERNFETMQRDSFEKYCREGEKACISSSQPFKLDYGDKKQNKTLQDAEKIQGVVEGTVYGNLNLRLNNQAMNFHSKRPSKPIWKKHRRSWTRELHERFVEALEFLGGPRVATPKQIRDVMKVEGLTNDQVKSHLQKYRFNNRGAPAANADSLECFKKFRTLTYRGSTIAKRT